MDNKLTVVFLQEVQWGRDAYIQIEGDKVSFDTSGGEYGPAEFGLQILIDAIKTHTNESDILRK